MGEITATEVPRMKTTQTSGWEVAAGISDSVEEIEIDELNIDENINSIDITALQDLIDYVQQKCVNQRDTTSFDKLKETDEFKQKLAECGLEGVQFDNYSDFLSKTSEIKIDAINSSTGINKEDYTPSGNTEQYLNDVESLTDDLEKQINYYNDVNNVLEKNMDSSIDKVDPTDDINHFLSYLSTLETSDNIEKEFYISQINSINGINSGLLSIISGLFPQHEANQDYTLGEGLTFYFDESDNLVVTDYDHDKLSSYLKSIQNEFKDENKYTSEVVARFVNDTNFDSTQSIYMQNTQIKNLLEEQEIKTVTDMYMYSIDTETGEMNYNQDYANYFNQDRFKKSHQESYSVYQIYQSMLDQSATLSGFDESFYELANYMDQDQLSVFIYLYGTQGSDAALDYVNLFKNEKTEYEAMREISNELETMINWPDEINEYSDMIYEVSNYISENYDNVTMDWDEFKNSEEFQEYIKQLAYYKYTYENSNNELDFNGWQESNQEYINNFVDGVTAFDNSEELISSLLTAETEMTYNYINEILNDPTQVKLKENIETLVLARLGGFGEGLMSGLSLTSNEREQLTQQYTASTLSQSMMLNIAYQVGNQEGSMLPSMYLGMIGGYYGTELAGQTLGIFGSTDSKAVDFINSILNKDMSSGSLGSFLASNTGRAIYGLDIFTNSFYSSKINGSTTGEAIGRAFLDSLIQVGAQTFIGSLPGLSTSGEYLAQDKLDAVRAWLCKSLQEGAANAATIYVTQGINSVLYGDEFDLDSITEEAYTQFIVGAIVGAETNVGQLANYKEKTTKITLNGLSYEVPIEDLYSLIEKNGKVSKEDMVKLVQGLSTSTISISAQAQELKEKYKLTDEEAIDTVNTMTKENVTEEVAAIIVKNNMSKEDAENVVSIIKNQNVTEEIATIMVTEKISKKAAEEVLKMAEKYPALSQATLVKIFNEGGSKIDQLTKEQFTNIIKNLSTYDEKCAFYKEYVAQCSLEWNLKELIAAKNYEGGVDAFYQLSNNERNKLINAVKDFDELSPIEKDLYLTELRSKRQDVAQSTIDKIEQLERNGNLKEGYKAEDVLSLIMTNTDQREYLNKEYIDEYYAKWEADDDGYIDVYCFQSMDDGTHGVVGDNGAIGIPGEGSFVMPKSEYDKLLADRDLFDENGICINTSKLMERLGGVKCGTTVVAVKQRIKIGDLILPTGSKNGAFIGEWEPGLYTSGGVAEGIAPPTTIDNPNVTIISHTAGTTDKDIRDKIDQNRKKAKE